MNLSVRHLAGAVVVSFCVGAFIAPVLTQTPAVYGPSYDRSTTDINLDLFPRDEYLVGSSFRPGTGGP